MKRCSRILYIIIGLVLLLVACKSQPDYVIEEDRMVDILVDIHKTEAVINLNYSQVPTDEKKRIVREAVYMRHNTTKADFDTSLVWYGNHLDVYMNVYDRVIEKLKKEDAELKELIAQENAQILTLAGDTVDIWKQQRWHVFDANKGENILSFTIDTDENFKERDHFTLRFHTINTPSINNDAVAHIAIRHKKHLIHYNYSNVKEGWNTIKVQTDSIQDLSAVYGYVAMPPRYDKHIMYIDSIELIRIHHTPDMETESFLAIDPTQEKDNGKDKNDVEIIIRDKKTKKKKDNPLKKQKPLRLEVE